MSALPPELIAHLQGGATTVCHCWRLTRRDGTVLGFTDHDRTLSIGGTEFRPETGWTASEARGSLGMAGDAADIEAALSSDAIEADDVRAGRYDDAVVETLLVNWQAPEQSGVIRRATIGRVTLSDGRFVAETETPAAALRRPRGRLFRAACDAELGDIRCGFDLGTDGFAGSGSVIAVEAEGKVCVAGLAAFPDGWLGHGRIIWTSGALTGVTTRVAQHRKDGGDVRLTIAGEAAAPAPGDGFDIVAGCDKRFATCKSKFANQLNFRGFPHMPGNDAAYAYVADGKIFDGGALTP